MNALPQSRRHELYACGVLLQNMESSVLKWLENAEREAGIDVDEAADKSFVEAVVAMLCDLSPEQQEAVTMALLDAGADWGTAFTVERAHAHPHKPGPAKVEELEVCPYCGAGE